MTSFYVLDPEVPGGLGRRTQLVDRPGTFPLVKRLHFEFSYGWLGDDLITSYPVYLVTAELGEALRHSGLSGFTLSADVEVSIDDQERTLEPGWSAPTLEWLQVAGQPGMDDIGLTVDARLVVSTGALAVLSAHTLRHCLVVPWM